MTYLADRDGLIYWALGRSLQDRRHVLRVVLSYIPVRPDVYGKCVFHGYDFELKHLDHHCDEQGVPDVATRARSLIRHDDVSGDQYLALPVREIDRIFAPVDIESARVNGYVKPVVLKAVQKRLAGLGIRDDHVRFYGRVACCLEPNGAPGDVDIVLDDLDHRTVIENDAARREEISLDGLDPFFLDETHRLDTVKRRWSLSQLELAVGETTVPLDVKIVAAKRPRDIAGLYHDRSWRHLHDVSDVEIEVTDARWVLAPAPLLWGTRSSDGEIVSVSSKHYMFSGMATEGDVIRVTGVMDDSGTRIALTNPLMHFVAVDLPATVRFVG